MTAQELRLNNFIQNKVNKTIEIVTGVEGTNIVETNLSSGGPDYYWEGIPLTEQWLRDFGFEIQDGAFVKNIVLFKNSIRDGSGRYNGFYPVFKQRTELEKIRPSCYHVHQLQNLYFALTGEELELKKHGK